LGGCEELRRGVVVAFEDGGLDGLAGVGMVAGAGREKEAGVWKGQLSPVGLASRRKAHT